MARIAVITYEDGTVDSVEIKPKHMIFAEQQIKGSLDAHAFEATFLAAWKASKSTLKFQAWLDTVDDISQPDDEDGDVDPTSDSSPDESLT